MSNEVVDDKKWLPPMQTVIEQWLERRESPGGKRTWNAGALAYALIELLNGKRVSLKKVKTSKSKPKKQTAKKKDSELDQIKLW